MHDASSTISQPCAVRGHRLRQLRVWANVSAEQVWRAAGISPRLLEMYEDGAVPLTPAHLAALAQCLGVSVAALGSVMPPCPADGAGHPVPGYPVHG